MRMYPRLTALFAIAVLFIMLTGTAPVQSDSYSIYFESDRDGETKIFRTDGDDAVAVTGEGCMHPSVTADGSMLLYTRIEETLWGRFWNVFYLVDGVEHKLTTNEIYDELEPVISRDGAFAAYTTMRGGNLEIITIPIDENELQFRITDSEKPDESPALASGDDWIYWTGRTGIYSFIFRAPGRGGEAERVTDDSTAWEERPSVSANGRFMAYVAVTRDVEPEDSAEDVEIDESAEDVVTDESAEDVEIDESAEESISWNRLNMPPSTEFVCGFDFQTLSMPGLLMYPGYAQSGVPETEDPEEPEVPVDGDAAEDEALEQNVGNLDIWILDMTTGERTRLTTDPAWDGNPSISADGEKIVFTSDRDGNYEIYMINRDGSDLTRITTNDAVDDFAVIT